MLDAKAAKRYSFFATSNGDSHIWRLWSEHMNSDQNKLVLLTLAMIAVLGIAFMVNHVSDISDESFEETPDSIDVDEGARNAPLRRAERGIVVPDKIVEKQPQEKSPELKLVISVKDSRGRAIHDVEVILWKSQELTREEYLLAYGPTDESGEFVMRTRLKSVYVVVRGSRERMKVRYGDLRETLTIPSGLKEHRIELTLKDCNSALSIKAVTESGDPVSNLEVLAVELLGRRSTVMTDESGELFLDNLQPGRMWIQSTATSATLPKVCGTESQNVVLLPGESTLLRLILKENGHIEVSLKFHGDSEAIKCHVRVSFNPTTTIRSEFRRPSLVLTESNPTAQVSAPTGSYIASCDAAHLPTSVSAEPIVVVSNMAIKVIVHVYLEGGSLRGEVVDYDGNQVVGALVSANFVDPLSGSETGYLNTVTDAQGLFDFEVIPAKSARLNVMFGYSMPPPKPQFAFFGDFQNLTQEETVGDQDVLLKLERGHSIHVECGGTIKDGERIAIDRYRWTISQKFDLEGKTKLKIHKLRREKYTLSRVSSSGTILATTTVDLRNLPVGTYSATVRFK